MCVLYHFQLFFPIITLIFPIIFPIISRGTIIFPIIFPIILVLYHLYIYIISYYFLVKPPRQQGQTGTYPRPML